MKKGTALIITGLALIMAALFLIGYNYWDDKRAARAANEVLEQLRPLMTTEEPPTEKPTEPASKPESPTKATADPKEETEATLPEPEDIEYPDYELDPDMDMPEWVIDGVTYIGVLSIPSIEKELPVFSSWDYDKLLISACRYSGSIYNSTMVICAHNYTAFFERLKDMRYGDRVLFTDADGNVFTYEVEEIETNVPTAVDLVIHSDWDLTLFTCTKGGAYRVTARCRRVDQ